MDAALTKKKKLLEKVHAANKAKETANTAASSNHFTVQNCEDGMSPGIKFPTRPKK